MTVLFRYACLLCLGFASLFVFISAGAVTGQLMLADSQGAAAVNPQDMNVWVLGGIASLGLMSVVRFALGRLPLMIRDWFRDNKDRLATVALACIVGFFFVVL
ncbi:MAG: hypothetical protein Kow0032_23340 [Methyloligellaceae bacterium]|nr:MAG: hypothetical protein D6773_00680 [Alphaproteobacteria bacterium]